MGFPVQFDGVEKGHEMLYGTLTNTDNTHAHYDGNTFLCLQFKTGCHIVPIKEGPVDTLEIRDEIFVRPSDEFEMFPGDGPVVDTNIIIARPSYVDGLTFKVK